MPWSTPPQHLEYSVMQAPVAKRNVYVTRNFLHGRPWERCLFARLRTADGRTVLVTRYRARRAGAWLRQCRQPPRGQSRTGAGPRMFRNRAGQLGSYARCRASGATAPLAYRAVTACALMEQIMRNGHSGRWAACRHSRRSARQNSAGDIAQFCHLAIRLIAGQCLCDKV